MTSIVAVLLFAVGALAGALIAYLVSRNLFAARLAEANARLTAESTVGTRRVAELTQRVTDAEAELRQRNDEVRRIEGDNRALQADAASFNGRIGELTRIQEQMKESFAALSAEALRETSSSFFQIAQRELQGTRAETLRDMEEKERSIGALLDPIRTGLTRYDEKVDRLVRERDEAFGKLTGQLQRVEQASAQLSQETHQLSRALRSPAVRGQWGELQLRRVIEISGMVENCDFDAQPVLPGDGAQLRPDVIIRLPGGRSVIVDSKVPLTAYLEALEATDDEKRRKKMKDHAAQLRSHSDALGKKSYWERAPTSPEFVVLFLPSEVFFSAALEADSSLIEDSFTKNRVIIATPTTLIALLQSVAYGWRQESITRSAQEIADLGKELYERLSKLDDHFGDLGDHLEKAMKFYNNAVGALESRVLVSARRFKDLGIGSSVSELRVLEPIELPVRGLRSPELTDGVAE
jgi:DNA recombination protein RmuC